MTCGRVVHTLELPAQLPTPARNTQDLQHALQVVAARQHPVDQEVLAVSLHECVFDMMVRFLVVGHQT